MLLAKNNSLMNKFFLCLCFITQALTIGAANNAAPQFPNEDGSKLWLRYNLVSTPAEITGVHGTAMEELKSFWKGQPIELRKQRSLGHDDYVITTAKGKTLLTAGSNVGLLYGAYHLLRLQQADADCTNLNIKEHPTYELRILNHWDNPDGTVERGFAGRSIFWTKDPLNKTRIQQYGRANASIGINGTVLNNVNAKPATLSYQQLERAKQIADILRPYGIRVYLSINFASPMRLGGLSTADPLNADVIKWWEEKVAEIYKMIPDFGGFLVKANSEGEPGPCDYGRSHAEGANMLAKVLKKHNGIVMWRSFVYDPNDNDRAKQAYKEFMPLDGQFLDNVIIQIKNGPIDFQPREPYSPLFTGMKKTSMMAELQITQEYLGAANHLVFLSPMWKEFLGSINPSSLKAMAGVANIGNDTNWCGHHFAQANWYAFGRLAWNPQTTSEQIAEEWFKQTFESLPSALNSQLMEMMLTSHEAAVSYMMPLGLHHIFAEGHHYGPAPWFTRPGMRRDWTPPYYHQADSIGLGFDRSHKGTDAVSQYPEEICRIYDNINTCPENLLAWFHHVSWDYKMKNGRTFWDELCHKYDEGVSMTRTMLKTWDKTEQFIDQQRFTEVQRKLRIQVRDAVWWHDACILYFQTFSKRPIPQDVENPVHNLDEMMNFKINITMYENPEYGYNK